MSSDAPDPELDQPDNLPDTAPSSPPLSSSNQSSSAPHSSTQFLPPRTAAPSATFPTTTPTSSSPPGFQLDPNSTLPPTTQFDQYILGPGFPIPDIDSTPFNAADFPGHRALAGSRSGGDRGARGGAGRSARGNIMPRGGGQGSADIRGLGRGGLGRQVRGRHGSIRDYDSDVENPGRSMRRDRGGHVGGSRGGGGPSARGRGTGIGRGRGGHQDLSRELESIAEGARGVGSGLRAHLAGLRPDHSRGMLSRRGVAQTRSAAASIDRGGPMSGLSTASNPVTGTSMAGAPTQAGQMGPPPRPSLSTRLQAQGRQQGQVQSQGLSQRRGIASPRALAGLSAQQPLPTFQPPSQAQRMVLPTQPSTQQQMPAIQPSNQAQGMGPSSTAAGALTQQPLPPSQSPFQAQSMAPPIGQVGSLNQQPSILNNLARSMSKPPANFRPMQRPGMVNGLAVAMNQQTTQAFQPPVQGQGLGRGLAQAAMAAQQAQQAHMLQRGRRRGMIPPFGTTSHTSGVLRPRRVGLTPQELFEEQWRRQSDRPQGQAPMSQQSSTMQQSQSSRTAQQAGDLSDAIRRDMDRESGRGMPPVQAAGRPSYHRTSSMATQQLQGQSENQDRMVWQRTPGSSLPMIREVESGDSRGRLAGSLARDPPRMRDSSDPNAQATQPMGNRILHSDNDSIGRNDAIGPQEIHATYRSLSGPQLHAAPNDPDDDGDDSDGSSDVSGDGSDANMDEISSSDDEEVDPEVAAAAKAKFGDAVQDAEKDRAEISNEALAASGIEPMDSELDDTHKDGIPHQSWSRLTFSEKSKNYRILVRPTNYSRDFFHRLSSIPEVIFELATHLHPKSFLALYSISRDFHALINGHMTHCMLLCAEYQAPESASIFQFRWYSPLCIPDPVERLHTTPAVKFGPVNLQAQQQTTQRKVPGPKWLQMVIHREKTVRNILACLAREGHRLPQGTALSIKKAWFVMDIATSARRVQLCKNRKWFTDTDIYFLQMWVIKLDMRFNHPIDGPGDDGLRRLFLGQRGLTPLCRLLQRRDYLDAASVIRAMIRYSWRVLPHRKHLPVMGIPPQEIGVGHLEGWGKGRVHLLRVDELVAREAVRRRLELENRFVYMILYGYVDGRTGQNIKVTDEEMYMSDDEGKLVPLPKRAVVESEDEDEEEEDEDDGFDPDDDNDDFWFPPNDAEQNGGRREGREREQDAPEEQGEEKEHGGGGLGLGIVM